METQVRSGDWRITTLGTAILQSRFRTLQRPATPFELMDDAISYYRENFKPLFRISLWIYLIPIIFSILLLGPTLYLESLGTTGQLGALAVEYLGLFMLLPYLTIAPVAQVAFTTLAFRKIAAGEPITLRSLWESLKPRALHLIANQLLAIMALGAILTIISLGYIALTIAVVLGVMMVAAGSPTLAIILMATLLLIITIVALVLAAYATVWFLPLPQIIVLEPNADAISAFSRAYELVRPNLKHAVLSCLAFWGVQAVFMLAVMILSLI
ncbi:MAG: hypothetical protein NZ843_05945, partial [Fimbriimonadales bacterium]|nr:hypothetical protein [Fimbriimonadales bacterium]